MPKKTKEKIVLVTAGGPISCFHAAMERMHETLEEKAPGKYELVGAWGGLSGLIKGEFERIYYEDLDEDKAGSLIGADRKIADTSKIREVVKKNNIYSVVMMGGDNHLGEAAKIYKETGVNIVGYPKTMDGDLDSLISLGWESAVTVGAKATRNHHATAMTTRRIFYAGLFGRNTDLVPCAVSLYGGADRCIPCEQEYEWEYIWEKINESVKENQEKFRVPFAVVNFSEGAKIKGIKEPPEEHCSYDAHGLPKLQPEWLGLELVRLTKEKKIASGFECYTYSMRDTPPTETDKRLSRMAGEECINMVLEGDFGKCVVFEPEDEFYKTGRKPLEEVAVQRKLKPTGFFDYQELKARESFLDVYGNLFMDSLGEPPKKEDLVYKNMLRK